PHRCPLSLHDALPISGAVALCAAPASFAYRPFDGTDAAVAGRGELEIELGPAGLLRIGPDRFLVAPALIVNLGFADRWELVLERSEEHTSELQSRGHL